MTRLRNITATGVLLLTLVTTSYAGTITGSRTSASGSRAGTITGSRAGTITGSSVGTSRTVVNTIREEFLFSLLNIIVASGW